MLQVIRNRRSVRRFLSKPVDPGKIHELLKAAFFAPTAKNLRPVEFIVVQDLGIIGKLSLATPYSNFVKHAPLVIAVCYNVQKGRRFQEDCAMAAENVYLEATGQGLGTCYIQIAAGTEADVGNPEEYAKKLLAVPDTHRILCLMAIGYPEIMPAPHADGEYDAARVHHERFGNR